jgi:pyruvate dehydrogenase complex dehydrogenase (E1) component
LSDNGVIDSSVVSEAIELFSIDPNKANPLSVKIGYRG